MLNWFWATKNNPPPSDEVRETDTKEEKVKEEIGDNSSLSGEAFSSRVTDQSTHVGTEEEVNNLNGSYILNATVLDDYVIIVDPEPTETVGQSSENVTMVTGETTNIGNIPVAEGTPVVENIPVVEETSVDQEVHVVDEPPISQEVSVVEE